VNKVLCISDLHVGSVYALMPEGFVGEGGVEYRISQGQKRLLAYWNHLIETLHEANGDVPWKVDEVWVVGDVFAGSNYRERGRNVVGTFDEQIAMAVELLKDIPFKMKVWSGTGYHESVDVQMHRMLVEELRLAGLQAEFRGSWSFEDIGETKAFVAHHASGASIYRHTAMMRDSLWFKARYADGVLPKVDWIIRAHKHSAEFLDDGGIHVLQLPAWQAFVPFDSSVRMFPVWQPDIGGVFIWVDDAGRRRHQMWLYPPVLMDFNGNLIELPYDKRRYVTGWQASENLS